MREILTHEIINGLKRRYVNYTGDNEPFLKKWQLFAYDGKMFIISDHFLDEKLILYGYAGRKDAKKIMIDCAKGTENEKLGTKTVVLTEDMVESMPWSIRHFPEAYFLADQCEQNGQYQRRDIIEYGIKRVERSEIKQCPLYDSLGNKFWIQGHVRPIVELPKENTYYIYFGADKDRIGQQTYYRIEKAKF